MRNRFDDLWWLPLYAAEGTGGGGDETDDAGDDGANQEAGDDAGEAESADEQAAAPKPDWRDKQLRKRNAQLAEARQQLTRAQEFEAENARLKALLEAAQKGAAAPAAGDASRPAPAAPAGLSEKDVDARAELKAAQKQFDRDVAAALAQGAKDYPKDWEASIENIKRADGFDPEVLAQILGTDNPAKIIYELGKDPDRFEEVNNLPPHRRMVEFVKMTIPVAKKAVSNAAEPVTPVGARGVSTAKVNVYDPGISDEEYYAARAAQTSRKARYHRGLSGD